MVATPQALICRPADGTNHLSLEDVDPPSLQPNQVLVRNKAVAQNPTDIQSFDGDVFGSGAVLGCDFCGRVEKVGEAVSRVEVGDRIAGFLWGGEVKGLGAYATYTVADEKICFVVPGGVPSESAAALPLALTTAWLAFFSSKCLGIDRELGKKNSLLIWGGSSSVGLYAIQIAKMFNFNFATTCTNAEIVKDVGATQVFNYKSPTIVEDIRKALPDLTYVFDCIGSETTSIQASKAVKESGGTLCTVRPGLTYCKGVEPRVKATDVLVFTAFLKDHKYRSFSWPTSQEDHDLASELYEKLPGLLRDGTIKPNDVKLVDGGLKGVAEGFKLYRDKAYSGKKVVYNLE